MGAETIKVSPSQLQTHSLTAKTGASNTKSLSNDMGTAISELVTSMNTVPVLGNASAALETFSTGLMATLECFALGMSVVDQGLVIAARDFKGLDVSLASSFEKLEGQLGYYTGFGTTFTMPTLTPVQLQVKGLSVSFTTPHHSSFWGSVGNFFSNHWKEIAAGALIVGGLILTPVTAGGSDALADTAAAGLLADATVATGTELVGGLELSGGAQAVRSAYALAA
ncbi:MAG TPA: hypothetical protein VF458_14390 [Ktedonobacteraceae bacterium]